MTLILVSDFMQDEIYLNEEVKYYKSIDRPILFTVRGHVYSNSRMDIPDNFEIGKLDIQYKSNIDRLKHLLKGVFNKLTFNDFKYLVKNNKLSYNSFKSLMLFAAKSSLVYDNMKKRMDSLGIKEDEKITLYSYRVGFSSLVLCKLKKKYKNAKVISRAHAQDIFEFRNKENYLPFRQYLYENIDEICCISSDGMHYLNDNYEVLKNKTSLYRLGTRNVPLNENVNNSDFTILTCSRIARIKRLDLLAKSLLHIDKKINWVHYGDGDTAYYEEIKDITNKYKSNINVDFVGFCDNEKYLDIISKRNLSVFVNVSESEGLPVSIMEAESVGLPIIATDVGGTSEAVIDGFNGYLVDKDITEEDLAKTILKIKDMPKDRYDKMRYNSRKVWEEKFDLSNNYSDFVEHL